MTTKERVNADFMAAFKARDLEKKTFFGLLKGEIQLESSKETYKGEDTDKAIITTMVKSLKTVGDADSLRELSYIEDYLPKQMSEEDLRSEIQIIIDTKGLTSPREMGQVMGDLKSNHDGAYDGKLASKITKELLS